MAGKALVTAIGKGAKHLAKEVAPSLFDEAAEITQRGWQHSIKTGKLTQNQADNILKVRNIEEFDKFAVEGTQEMVSNQRAQNLDSVVNKFDQPVPDRPTFKDWKAGAQIHYDEQWAAGNRMDPMRGYPHFTDVMQENPTSLKPDRPGIRSYKISSGGKIEGDPTGKRKLSVIDKDLKKKGVGKRTVTEEIWVDELTKGLKEYGIDEKEAQEIINTMKRENKLQDVRRKTRNDARKKANPNLPNDQLLTIEHIGALKNKWPNIPENRWGLITKKANSRAGARLDPADINIRMQGTPGKGKHGTWVDEKARKVVLDKEMGSDNWDPTRNLPEKIKRKILKAKSIDEIDDILTEFLE